MGLPDIQNIFFFLDKGWEDKRGQKKSPCLAAKVLKYDHDHKTSFKLGRSNTFSPRWDCQHYSSRHVSACSLFLKKTLKPHPDIVTVLWSITVTSPRCLNCVDFSDWVLEWLSGIFIFYQNLAHDLSHTECLYQFPCLLLVLKARLLIDICINLLYLFDWKRCLLEPALQCLATAKEPMAQPTKAEWQI